MKPKNPDPLFLVAIEAISDYTFTNMKKPQSTEVLSDVSLPTINHLSIIKSLFRLLHILPHSPYGHDR